MSQILRKKLYRDFKSNPGGYLALSVLIVLGIFLVSSIIGSAETVMHTTASGHLDNQVEDGQFSLMVPLSTTEKIDLEDCGIHIEENFYLDFEHKANWESGHTATVRIYKNRKAINLVAVSEGRLAVSAEEIALEQNFARHLKLSPGMTFQLGGQEFIISGLVSSPDYDNVLRELSDVAASSSAFGTGFLTPEAYNSLLNLKTAIRAEEYLYSFRRLDEVRKRASFEEKSHDSEILKHVKALKAESREIQNPYFHELENSLSESKNELEKALNSLKNGGKELSQGLNLLQSKNEELLQASDLLYSHLLNEASEKLLLFGLSETLSPKNYQSVLATLSKARPELAKSLITVSSELHAAERFVEGLKGYTDGVAVAASGGDQVSAGLQQFEEQSTKLIKEYFHRDIPKLVQFVKRADNPRISAASNDVIVNRNSGIAAGFIVLLLFAYVIALFVLHQIDEESKVIGALYALGLQRKELLRYYLSLPVLLSFLSAAAGMALSFTPIGIDAQVKSTTGYFSLPLTKLYYPAYLWLYCLLLPPFIAAIVNYIVIKRKLSQTAIALLRKEPKIQTQSGPDSSKFKFATAFRIKRLYRERRSTLTMFAGIFIALLILILSLNASALCIAIRDKTKADANFAAIYSFKFAPKRPPANADAVFAKTLKKEVAGYNLDISLIGKSDDSRFYPFKTEVGKNKITLSDAMASKCQVKVGDLLVLSDKDWDMDYAFTVTRIVPYSIGLHCFMNIDSMRSLFDVAADHYNVLVSGEKLEIDADRLYSVTTKEDVVRGGEVFVDSMRELIIVLISASVLMFALVIYLMSKVMIDRAATEISMFKLFGYNDREIRCLFMDVNFITVSLSAVLGIPLARLVIGALYPYLVANVSCGMYLNYPFTLYLLIFGGILFVYITLNKLILRRIQKIEPALVLKER